MLCVYHPLMTADSYIEANINQLHNSKGFKVLHSALMDAYIEKHLFEKGFKGTAKVEKKALQTAKNDANEMLAEIAKNIEDYKNKIDDTSNYYEKINNQFDILIEKKAAVAKRIIRSKVDQLDKLKKKYTEELALQIPVTYWNDKAKGHMIASAIWGVVFVASIIVIILNASDIFHQIIEGLKIVDKDGKELFNFTDNQLETVR